MKYSKKAKKSSARIIVWAITSIFLVAVMFAANVLTDMYSGVIDVALGGVRAVAVENEDGEASKIYQTAYGSEAEATEAAFAVTQEIAEEGTILLKNENNTLPLTKGGALSVFGKNSVDLVYGGLGSGRGDQTFERKTIFESLTSAGFTYNGTLKAFYEDDTKSGAPRQMDIGANLDPGSSGSYYITETPYTSYTSDVIASYDQYDDAAIVVFSRTGSENFDLNKTASADGSKHYLSLNNNEKQLLEEVSAKFEKVIVVLNTLNIMEVDFLETYDIDACLWIGGPGTTGIMALGKILNGEVTPSGSTTDTWAVDFTKDPTYNNMSDTTVYQYYRSKKYQANYYYTHYVEDIYVGYRYYETRGYEELKADANSTWYEDNVQYPFGYGLSYTTFDWEVEASSIENVSIEKDGTYTIDVTVTNTGDYKGKDVVELYAQLHYNQGGLEKAHKVLCGFAKTPMLYPADEANGTDKPNSCKVTLTFNPYDIASYDYLGKSGTTGYVIEAGSDYALHVAKNAHDTVEEIPFEVSTLISYDKDPVTGYEVKNLYTGNENELLDSNLVIKDSLLSRSNISAEVVDLDAENLVNIDETWHNAISDKSTNNPYVDTYQLPSTEQSTEYKIESLLRYDEETGVTYAPYDKDDYLGNEQTDEIWESILNALTVEEMASLFNNGAFGSVQIESIGKPLTLESDGPIGWCNFISVTDNTWTNNNAYTSQVVMSATWNVDLIYKMGECVGEEGLWGDATKSNGLTYSGWYSPGVNLHRSPFGGRNFEYFSEDSYLTGMIAAAEIQGCQSKGVYCYVKHFALNEQEYQRGGNCSWVSEQAMREIYLKPFELCVKVGKTRAMMSSFNRIGTRWTGGDYRLMTEILRNEWGFKGTVISDYNEANPQIDSKQMVYGGGDLNLCTTSSNMWNDYDASSAADVTVLRMAAKNIIYTVVNSNAVNSSFEYKMAYWRIALYTFYVVVSAVIVIWGISAIVKTRKQKKSKKKS